MPNVMEMRNLKNKVSRNGFDLSTNKLLSARVGEITPIFCKMVMPGDNFELYPSHFSRTQPLNTAAYASIKESINFFKVPFHLLHNQFDVFVSNMQDNPQVANSISSNQTISDRLPYITEHQLASLVYKCSQSQVLDELKYYIAPRIVKLLQYLGYGDYSYYLNHAPTYAGRRLSPFPLLAYQKIYYDYYRYQQWEQSSPWCFNINYAPFDAGLPIDNIINDIDLVVDSLFTPRYANFKKDYFLGVLPSAQYGDSSVVPVLTSNTPTVVVDKSSNSSWDSISAGNPIGSSFTSFNTSVREIVNNPSVLSIRKAEAIQKLREIQQSGNQDYKEQVEKIFGVTMSDDKSDLCTWLGGYDSTINISEVVNQSLNGDDSAQIKGKGTSNGGDKISFQSDDFYLVIGIYTATPKLYYDVNVSHHENQMVSLDDFPNPVLDRIGMESVKYFDLIGYRSYNGDISTSSYLNKTFGYAPRYFRFKTSYDEVLGAFKRESNSQLRSWVAPFADFIPRLFLGSANPESNYMMFKIDPNILNPITVSQVSKADTSELSDMTNYWNDEQFIINLSIGCAAVRPLDYDGLPYT